MSCDSVFHQYLQSIAEFWPVRFSLALSLAPASSGFCNSLTNKLSGVGGGGRNRTDAYSFCRAVPYHLATPPLQINRLTPSFASRLTHPPRQSSATPLKPNSLRRTGREILCRDCPRERPQGTCQRKRVTRQD